MEHILCTDHQIQATSLTKTLLGVKYLECSARTGEGIQSVIQLAAELLLQTPHETIYKKADRAFQTSPVEATKDGEGLQRSLLRRINWIAKRNEKVVEPYVLPLPLPKPYLCYRLK